MQASPRRQPAEAATAALAASLALLLLALHAAAQPWGPGVIVVRVTGTIDRGTYYYIRDAVALARERHWPLVVYLDTPGGYLDAALDIVDLFDHSGVPIVAYAGGRWAVSAGTLLLISAPLAYAAPYTVIGSMQPVVITPEGVRPVNESKIINTLLKIVEVHCEVYGRNYTAARLFVTRNLNLDGLEAYRMHVVDGVARDIQQLVLELNGTRVKLFDGREALIVLDGSVYEYREPLRYRLVSALSDPALASLLLSLGALILVAALVSGHPGYASFGVLLLLLGLLGLGFGVNTVALLLVLLGSLLLALDLLHGHGMGVAGAAGAAMLVMGFALLPLTPRLLASRQLVEQLLYTSLAVGGFLAAVSAAVGVGVARVARRRPVVEPTPVGKVGRALDEIRPDKPGFVFIEGEYWMARSEKGVIRPGERVRVVAKDEHILIVERVGEGSAG